MPLETTTYDIESELADLESEREELAEQVADAGTESNAIQQLIEKGQRLDRYMAGLQWYVDEYDADEITLGALTNGERHQVRDTADKIGSDMAGRQNAYVAMGTVDGAYLEHDPDAIRQDRYEETIANVTDLHPAFVDWIENEVTQMGRMGEDTGNSFEELVLEKKTQANSPGSNG